MTLFLIVSIAAILAFLGTPLFAVILSIACAGFYFSGIDLSAIAIELYRLTDTPVMSALPLFTVAGYLLGESNTSTRLVRLSSAFLGWMPGGLAVVSFVTCALFTAFTGASGVTIVAVGALLLPALTRAGYDDKFSLGLVTTSGSLGLLLPPSLPLILYGIVAQQMGSGSTIEIEDLFIAGTLPAATMIVLLSIWSITANRGRAIPLQRFSWAEAVAAIREVAWEIPLPVFLIAGIYGGIFAVSEAAAVVALYVLVVEVFVYKEIPVARLPLIFREAMVMVGGILLILGVSLAFTNFLVDAEIPARLFTLIQGHISGRFTFLILLNLILLCLGAILDIFSAIVIMVPLLLPVAESYGINPIHLGIIFLANMQIGYFTPPVGMNLFIASYRFKKPVTEIYSSALPFMFVMLLALVIITYVPWLSLILL
ncbi:MAG: TRAP transporter large permease subunit [Desulfobacteraceae bacterium]|nr:TRAP transporter large permease subunit [Desulfobacteraceae bacterium]